MTLHKRLPPALLLATVFCTGGCLLILEVISTRLLAPYFGNTIYAFSSIIGITLGALSVGYAAGGRIADAHPKHAFFFGIILLSGLAMLLTKLLSVTLLAHWSTLFSLSTGPVVFSILLFSPPSVLLGMLSPFAIRLLQSGDSARAGSLSGNVFFFSTVGSIAGTFIAGFALIPIFGVQSILLMLAAVLLLLGLSGVVTFRHELRHPYVFLLFVLVGAAALTVFSVEKRNPEILYQQEGLYDSMMIYDAEFNGRMARFLRQNFNASSAVYLDNGELVFPYTRYYTFAEKLNPALKNALVIGAGAYSIPQALTQTSPGAVTDVVDIEPSLRDIAREYFAVADDPRIRTVIADGRRFLHDTDAKYDLIFSDAYQSLFSIPSHLATLEFFQTGRDSLSAQGIFLVNFSARINDEKPSLLWSAVRSFRTAFPYSSFFAVVSKDSPDTQNVIFLGCASKECADPCPGLLRAGKTAFFSAACGNQLAINEEQLRQYALLTDDYSPVEFLASKQL